MISLEEYFKENFEIDRNKLITEEMPYKFIEELPKNVTEVVTVSFENYFKSILTNASQNFMDGSSENFITTSYTTINSTNNNKTKGNFLKFYIDLSDGYNGLYFIFFIFLTTLCNLAIFLCVKKCINCLVCFWFFFDNLKILKILYNRKKLVIVKQI